MVIWKVMRAQATESFVFAQDLFRNLLRVADEVGSGWAASGLELGSCGGRPAAFFADVGEHALVSGEEFIGGLLAGRAGVAELMQANLQGLRARRLRGLPPRDRDR